MNSVFRVDECFFGGNLFIFVTFPENSGCFQFFGNLFIFGVFPENSEFSVHFSVFF